MGLLTNTLSGLSSIALSRWRSSSMAEPVANATQARARIVEMLRRDLIGPLPVDVALPMPTSSASACASNAELRGTSPATSRRSRISVTSGW